MFRCFFVILLFVNIVSFDIDILMILFLSNNLFTFHIHLLSQYLLLLYFLLQNLNIFKIWLFQSDLFLLHLRLVLIQFGLNHFNLLVVCSFVLHANLLKEWVRRSGVGDDSAFYFYLSAQILLYLLPKSSSSWMSTISLWSISFVSLHVLIDSIPTVVKQKVFQKKFLLTTRTGNIVI